MDKKMDIGEMQNEIETLRTQVDEWEEREASVCPEDMGFEEYIQTLKNRIARIENVSAWAQNGLRLMAEMAEDRGVGWVASTATRIRKGLAKP